MKKSKSFLQLLLVLVMTVTLVACGKKEDSGSAQKKEDKVLLVNFEGMSKLEVEEWINQNSISRDRVFYAYEYSDTVQEGKIISQSIAPGLPLGDENLTVTLSNGPDPDGMVELVDFSQMTSEQIQKWFMYQGFTNVTVEYVTDTNVPAGQFVGLNTTETKVRRSQPIVVKLAAEKTAPQTVSVKMENMNGWTKQQVEYWANMNQISVDYGYTRSASIPAGNVVTFSPGTGETVAGGSKIKVVLSIGNEITAIDLTGMNRTQIEKWGSDNGVQISWLQCWNKTAAGTIFWNQPNSGIMRIGDIMRVYISVGPIPVKDYTGLSYQNNFLGWFNSINSQYNQSAGLKVRITEKEVTDRESGVILSQSPNSGYINPSETITMVIAKKVAPTPKPTAKPTPAPTADPRVRIPSMIGMSEYDFKRSLHAYGVWEGRRTETYSRYVEEGYITWNETGVFYPEETVDYEVSLGAFTLDPDDWIGLPYDRLENYINSVNRFGADVELHPSMIDVGDPSDSNKVLQIMGPEENGDIHVRIGLYIPQEEEEYFPDDGEDDIVDDDDDDSNG